MIDTFRFQDTVVGLEWTTLGKFINILLQSNKPSAVQAIYTRYHIKTNATRIKRAKFHKTSALRTRGRQSRQVRQYGLWAELQGVVPPVMYTCSNPRHSGCIGRVPRECIPAHRLSERALDEEDRLICVWCAPNLAMDAAVGDILALLRRAVHMQDIAKQLGPPLVAVLTQLQTTRESDVCRYLYHIRAHYATPWLPDMVMGLGEGVWDRMQLVHEHMARDPLLHGVRLGVTNGDVHARTMRRRVATYIHAVNTVEVFGLLATASAGCITRAGGTDAVWDGLLTRWERAAFKVQRVELGEQFVRIWVHPKLAPWLRSAVQAYGSLPARSRVVTVSLFQFARRYELFQARPGEDIQCYLHVRPDEALCDIPTSASIKSYTVTAFLARLQEGKKVPATYQVILWPAHAVAGEALTSLLLACVRHAIPITLAGHLYVRGPTDYLFTQLAQTQSVPITPLVIEVLHPFSALENVVDAPQELPEAADGLFCPKLAAGFSPWSVAAAVYKAQCAAHWQLTPALRLCPHYLLDAHGEWHTDIDPLTHPLASDREVWKLATATLQSQVYAPNLLHLL
jgi:hypothetical protein